MAIQSRFDVTPRKAVRDTLALVLAGGAGTRLKDLTRWHSKPAVPFGGKYRTIDFALSNCINSDIRRIHILTQYKSYSLNNHIQKGWNFFRPELGEFIDTIPAQQRVTASWYAGTADAVFQNMDIIEEEGYQYILVLAGDHVYKMNYETMLQEHIEKEADMTVGCIEVPTSEATQFGVMEVEQSMRIVAFEEKPEYPVQLSYRPGYSLASMGIYIFSLPFLKKALYEDAELADSSHDFGKDIIPTFIQSASVFAYPFRDLYGSDEPYWQDVGTLDAYYEANMDLLSVTPRLNLYDPDWSIWTYQEQLPPAKFIFDDDGRRGYAVDSMVSAGCVVSGSKVKRSLLSSNCRLNSYSLIKDCVILPNVNIGRNCIIQKAIVEGGCKIPPGTQIGVDAEEDSRYFHISPKGVVLVTAETLRRKVESQGV